MRLSALLGVVLISACVTGSPPRQDDLLTGHWRSQSPEPLPPSQPGDVNYLVRELWFSEGRWRIIFTIHADASAATPILSGENGGRYVLEGASESAARAQFFFDQRTLTPSTPAIAAALNAVGCGAAPWRMGAAQSVLETGCPAFRVYARAICDREYDLVRRDGDRLYLGARPSDGDMCSADRCPSSTSPAALLRVE